MSLHPVQDAEFSDKAPAQPQEKKDVTIMLSTGVSRELQSMLGVEIVNENNGFLRVVDLQGAGHFFNPRFVVSVTIEKSNE